MRDRTLSWLAPVPHWRGGVAVLCNPHSTLWTWSSLFWSSSGRRIRWRCVPRSRAWSCIFSTSTLRSREPNTKLYDDLTVLVIPKDGPVWGSGDFNCTLNPVADRTWPPAWRHTWPALLHWCDAWRLVDYLTDEFAVVQDATTADEFGARRHTYHTTEGGVHASHRLDRWYCSRDHADWFRRCHVVISGPLADRNGVAIQASNPAARVFKRAAPVVYSVPGCAGEATAARCAL